MPFVKRQAFAQHRDRLVCFPRAAPGFPERAEQGGDIEAVGRFPGTTNREGALVQPRRLGVPALVAQRGRDVVEAGRGRQMPLTEDSLLEVEGFAIGRFGFGMAFRAE
jgi:hypothetical protein